MKIQFLSTCFVLGLPYLAGEVRTIDASIAKELVAKGLAVEAKSQSETPLSSGFVAEPEKRVLEPQKVAARK